MHRLYTRSPIAKVMWGILSTLIGIIALLLVLVSEVPRMEAQTINWQGRSVENGATLFDSNCATCHGPNGQGLLGRAPGLNSYYFFTPTGRLADVGWAGSLEDYVKLTIAAGRPSKTDSQWPEIMPTWGGQFGGPLRGDQVEDLTLYVMNWQESALAQTPEEDPFQPFDDVLKPVEFQNTAFLFLSDDEQTAALEEYKARSIRAPDELWQSEACFACHNLAARQEDEPGQNGPNLADLFERAGSRVDGMTAEEYVYQSIVDPAAFVVLTYEDVGQMPQNFAEKLSEVEIQDLVEWLLDPERDQEQEISE